MGAKRAEVLGAEGAQAALRSPPRTSVWRLANRCAVLAPRHPAARTLFTYWQSRCGPAGIPRRDDIIAAHIPRLLPHLAILEPVPGRRDWRLRLFGTSLAWRYELDWTGKRVREIYDLATAEALIEAYEMVAGERRPAFVVGQALARAAEPMLYEGAVLPIFGRDGTTVWMLIGTFFSN